jgi:tetratricopeptide (TPR) repeat protein
VSCFVVVTIGLAAVLWNFISSLQENSEKLGSYKAGDAWFGAKVKMPEGIDNSFLPRSDAVSAFKKSNDIYEDAQQLAMKGDYTGALTTGKAALAELESEIAARGNKATDSKGDDAGASGAKGDDAGASGAKADDAGASGAKADDAAASGAKADDAAAMESSMFEAIAKYGKTSDAESNDHSTGDRKTSKRTTSNTNAGTEETNKILSSRHAFLAKMYVHVKDYQSSLDEYGKAIELTPTLPVLFSCRAGVYARMNKYGLAAKDQERSQLLERQLSPRERAVERILGEGSGSE